MGMTPEADGILWQAGIQQIFPFPFFHLSPVKFD